MNVYRILKEPYWTDPLSVIGAERFPGRWNSIGLGILYTASSPALALLETIAHFPNDDVDRLPALRLFPLRLPNDRFRYVDPSSLPDNWETPELVHIMQHFFDEWLQQPDVLTLAVPSAVLDVSYNFLIHPAHPDFSAIDIETPFFLRFDKRLWRR